MVSFRTLCSRHREWYFAPIAIAAGTAGTLVGGSTIIVTKATGEYREYAGLEDCLERQGHDVIFYDARKAK